VGNLLPFLLLVGPLILFHELGHLVVAKLLDVKVLRFSIGFGPPFARLRVGETEYCLAPIPLGGYVTMLGQGASAVDADDPEAAAQFGPDAPRALATKPLWARALVLAAGPAANLTLPLVLYFFFFLGRTTLAPAVIGTVIDDSAAAAAGLRQGDRIVAIDGRDVRSWAAMSELVAARPGEELQVQIERDGRRFDRVVTPRTVVRRNAMGIAAPIGRLGVTGWFHAPQIGVVDPTSPAYVEGLRTGDVITSVNGEPVTTAEELARLLDAEGDATIRVTYLRAIPGPGPLGTWLWYESRHAQLLPRPGGETPTGLLAATTFVRLVAADSPAARAGLRAGDRLLAVDGVRFRTWEYFSEVLARKGAEPITLEVQSLGEAPRTVTVAQELKRWRDIYRQDREALWLGVTPHVKGFAAAPEPIRGRFTYAVASAWDETLAVGSMMWTTLRQMLTLQRGVDELSSVVGLFSVAGTAAEQGPGEFMLLMAILSMNLGFVNLLPIPVLDGGHLLFFAIEAVRRRPLGQRAREIASSVGLIIILVLLLVALRNDISRYWMGP
jgi:regulator of sigma E protease